MARLTVRVAVRVRELHCPPGVEEWRWQHALAEIGDSVIAHAIEFDEGGLFTFVYCRETVRALCRLLHGDDEAWTQDPDAWKGGDGAPDEDPLGR